MPRFQIPALKTTMRPTAIRSSGAIRIVVSCHAANSKPPDQTSL